MRAFDPFPSGLLRLLMGALLAALLSACGHGPATPADVVRHVDDPENGFVRSRRLGDLKVDVQYRPEEYLAARKARGNNMHPAALPAERQSSPDMRHFLLRMDVPGTGVNLVEYGIASEVDYQRRLHYFSFGMKDDLLLVQGTDTSRCALFHFERAFDLSTHRNFTLAFPRPAEEVSGDMTLIFDSREFNTGPLKFRFRAEALDNIPQISLPQ